MTVDSQPDADERRHGEFAELAAAIAPAKGLYVLAVTRGHDQDGTVQLWTYMSDDPTINSRRHEAIKEQQREAAERRSAQR